MAAFTAYTPTAQLTAAERTQAGYYGAIKAWAMAQADIAQYYSVSADDTTYTLTLTPIATNLANFPTSVSINSSYVCLRDVPHMYHLNSCFFGTLGSLTTAIG